MDAKLGTQPLHNRFSPNQFLKHKTKSGLFLQILRVLPGGYEVEVFIALDQEYEGAEKTNLPKLHVHNNFKGILAEEAVGAKLIKRLYGR